MILTLNSVEEILKGDHSTKSYHRAIVLDHYPVVGHEPFYKNNTKIHRITPYIIRSMKMSGTVYCNACIAG